MDTRRDALILKVSGALTEGFVDTVASELPVRLIVNNEPLVTLLCTPSELKELAAGFLLSEGIIADRNSISSLEVDEKEPSVRIQLSGIPPDFNSMFGKRTISSGCGKGITFTSTQGGPAERLRANGPMVSANQIRKILAEFRTISKLYIETGGVHSAALSDGDNILFFSEDIGRHNAVDKLIGRAFLESVAVENKMLITSGRVSSEIMTKAARFRFPVVISRAAPSCMSISYAEDMGITLIGFARRDRMNIYTWPNRIRLDE